jgi:predicted alpha/beta-hydrolase family hydrolase
MMPRVPSTFSFAVGTLGQTTGALYRAADPRGVTLVLAHGAGAPRTHPFMTTMAKRIAARGIDVATFNFLYAETGRKMPDRVEALEATWRAAIAAVRARSGLSTERLFIGGKSMGGRIATHIAAAKEGLVIGGVVLLGYPLHPPGKSTVKRDEILHVDLPMLIVQGTRDAFGSAADIAKFVAKLPRARVVPVEGGDHSLVLPKAEGREQKERAFDVAADAIASFVLGPKKRPKKR